MGQPVSERDKVIRLIFVEEVPVSKVTSWLDGVSTYKAKKYKKDFVTMNFDGWRLLADDLRSKHPKYEEFEIERRRADVAAMTPRMRKAHSACLEGDHYWMINDLGRRLEGEGYSLESANEPTSSGFMFMNKKICEFCGFEKISLGPAIIS
jgi:hypothetical protein